MPPERNTFIAFVVVWVRGRTITNAAWLKGGGKRVEERGGGGLCYAMPCCNPKQIAHTSKIDSLMQPRTSTYRYLPCLQYLRPRSYRTCAARTPRLEYRVRLLWCWYVISVRCAALEARVVGGLLYRLWSAYGYAEARETSTLLMVVRAFLEAFQSSLLDRKAANDLLITYLRAEAVVLTA